MDKLAILRTNMLSIYPSLLDSGLNQDAIVEIKADNLAHLMSIADDKEALYSFFVDEFSPDMEIVTTWCGSVCA